MIQVTQNIELDDNEIQMDFIRSSGPGGQNVNKVSTSVQLRFDAAASPSLPDDVRQRLLKLARGYITGDGILIIEARRFRTQQANRQDAVDRLVKLIQKAAEKPKPRIKTKPTKASQEKRLEIKKKRSDIKQMRGRVRDDSGE